MKTMVLRRSACMALAFAALGLPAVARAGVVPLPIAGAWDCNMPAAQTRLVLVLEHGDRGSPDGSVVEGVYTAIWIRNGVQLPPATGRYIYRFTGPTDFALTLINPTTGAPGLMPGKIVPPFSIMLNVGGLNFLMNRMP